MFAEVILNSSVTDLNRVFDYAIPEGMKVSVGMRVKVPFAGRKELEIGYVINLKDISLAKCREISEIVDYPLDEGKIRLAKWMARRYFCNLASVLKLLVPPGTSNNANKVLSKTEKWVYLADEYFNPNILKSEKQRRIVNFLLDNTEAPISEVCDFLDVSTSIVSTLIKNKILEVRENDIYRDPFKNKGDIKRTEAFKLSEEQQIAFDSVRMGAFEKYLLFGVTGSGKTEVYLQLIDKVLKAGKTAVVLVPEISLTPQITNVFLARFGEQIAILHSRLSPGERYDEWRKIKNGGPKIVIGVRSAIFAPISNLGIIIIDEEHDSSYKSEAVPKYDALEVAEYIARENSIPLLLGSATPDIRTYYNALHGDINLLKMTKRPRNSVLPKIEIVDLRDELANGNRSIFSKRLTEEINKNLSLGEQVMLFLNRRGYSTFVMCRDCGFVVKCNNCDVSMTYHKTTDSLLCHYCGKRQSNLAVCPECGSKNIKYFGTGTQKLESEINKCFPDATSIRMDVDTTRTKNAYENIINKFRDEHIDILLGTQMITKGHDIPNVTLVGILAADASINVGDYRANERTFQLLTQVAGRAGRGEKSGRAIIQTYMPDEFSIICSKNQNYEEFYNKEIIIREKLKYPPFCDIITCNVSGLDDFETKLEIDKLYSIFQGKFETYKPMPSPISRINGEYRYRILIKALINEEIIDMINLCIKQYDDIKNDKIRMTLDVNSNNML